MATRIVDISGALSSAESHALRIGEVAARTGLTQRTIRYYEELGLLPTPNRTEGDFRQYGEADVNRLRDIVRLRDLFGFSLAEIRSTIESEAILEQLRTEYRSTEDIPTRIKKLDEALKLTKSQMELIERKMAQLQEFRTDLAAREQKYSKKRAELVHELDKRVMDDTVDIE